MATETGFLLQDGRRVLDGLKEPLEKFLDKDWLPHFMGGYWKEVEKGTERTQICFNAPKLDSIFYQTSWTELNGN